MVLSAPGGAFFPPTLPTSKSQKEHGFPNVPGESRECGCTEKKDFFLALYAFPTAEWAAAKRENGEPN